MDTIDEIIAQAEEQQRRIEEVQRSIERTEVTGRSRNNGVMARVRGTGVLTEVTIDPRLLQRYEAKAIGSFVVEAVNDAMQRIGELHRQKFAPFLAEAEAQLAEVRETL